MKKIIKTVDEKRGIMQITTADERWYTFPSQNKETGLPEYRFIPSVTWIAGHYPKGIGFYKWLADKGWDEAKAIKTAAGDKGSKVHQAIEMWLGGAQIWNGASVMRSSATSRTGCIKAAETSANCQHLSRSRTF